MMCPVIAAGGKGVPCNVVVPYDVVVVPFGNATWIVVVGCGGWIPSVVGVKKLSVALEPTMIWWGQLVV